MKHRKFCEVYPYTYYMKNVVTGQKYHGVRWGNVKQSRTPLEDFGIVYFSSGKLRKSYKNNPDDYIIKIKWTFDTIEEARFHEEKINTNLMYKGEWEVWNNSKSIYNEISPSLGRKVRGTPIADKIGKSNRGKKRSEKIKKQISETQLNKILMNEHYFCTEKHSATTSKRMKQNNPSHGGLSEEHKKKIGDSQRGKSKPVRTDEHRKKISESLKGNIPWNKGKRGVQKTSEQTRKKMSETRKGKRHTEETRKKMSKNAFGANHLIGKKVCCVCCRREWDLGNYSKHINRGR
jgi:hypothetical protein